MKEIQPVVVGRGMAGQAILKSLAVIPSADPDLCVHPPVIAERGNPLARYVADDAPSLLFLANPSGLHAQALHEGASAGFKAIVMDKPVCVRREEIPELGSIKLPVSVLHGYRVAWGPRTIKTMIDAGEFGEVFSIESRYWQSSSAQMVLSSTPDKRAWKNDPRLNGPYDALTDLGSHVVDMILFLLGEKPQRTSGWITNRNSPAPHRDTHVQLELTFTGSRRASASISKTCHGFTNSFEFTVIGTRAAATWKFLNPDEIAFGAGNKSLTIRRESPNPTTGMAPFHGLGWLEGYATIIHRALRAASDLPSEPVPTLMECLDVMDVLLNAQLDV